MARGVSLARIERELTGRALLVAKGDPVIPFVSRLARIIHAQMTADAERDEEAAARADAAYDALIEDAREAAGRWNAQGRRDRVHRLEILLRTEF